MTKKLFLDADNTIWNTTKAFVDAYNLVCGKRFMFDKKEQPRWELVEKYDFTDQIPNLTKLMKYAIFDSDAFYEKLEYYDNAKQIINEVSQKTEVHIVSMCSPDSAKRKYLKIKEDLPLVKFQPIFFDYRDKSSIDMRNGIFIDDVVKNLNNSSADKNICFKYNGITMDINKDWQGEVLTNWDENTYNILNKLLFLE